MLGTVHDSVLQHHTRLPHRTPVRRRVVVLCFALGLMLFIIEQYIEPIVENSIGPMRTMVSEGLSH